MCAGARSCSPCARARRIRCAAPSYRVPACTQHAPQNQRRPPAPYTPVFGPVLSERPRRRFPTPREGGTVGRATTRSIPAAPTRTDIHPDSWNQSSISLVIGMNKHGCTSEQFCAHVACMPDIRRQALDILQTVYLLRWLTSVPHTVDGRLNGWVTTHLPKRYRMESCVRPEQTTNRLSMTRAGYHKAVKPHSLVSTDTETHTFNVVNIPPGNLGS